MSRLLHIDRRDRDGCSGSDGGFTLVELMVVVLIIGVLVTIAIPVLNIARERSMQRTCFGNQRTIAGAVLSWAANDEANDVADLAGVIDATHPLVNSHIFNRPPRCPAGAPPANPGNPAVAEGAYSLDNGGKVLGCTFGTPAHGDIYN